MIWHVLLVLLAASVGVMAVVLIAIMRQVGGILVQLNPARIGEVDSGPEIGSVVRVPTRADGMPAIVVFASPTCTLCEFLGPALPALRRHYPELGIVPIVLGDDPRARREYAERLGHGALTDQIEVGKEWDVQGTPFAVGVDGEGRVKGRGVANSLDHLESLAETVLAPEIISAEGEELEEGGEVAPVEGNGNQPAHQHADVVS